MICPSFTLICCWKHLSCLIKWRRWKIRISSGSKSFKDFKAEPDVVHISQSIYQLAGIIDDLMEDAHDVNLISLEHEVLILASITKFFKWGGGAQARGEAQEES